MAREQDILNPADFHSLKLLVSFQNTSTGTAPLSPEACSLVSIGEKLLVLEVPAASCNRNHAVFLRISVSEGGKKAREVLAVTGKVTEMEAVSTGAGEDVRNALRVGVDCIQFDETSWQELLAIYANRQDAITAFLKAAKGY